MESQPFVLDVPEAPRERIGDIDVYRPGGSNGTELLPLIVFVHGGPIPPDAHPRDAALFVGYGSLAAVSGAVGITVEHRLYSAGHCATAADDVAAAIDRARNLPGVDPNRVAIWVFSGGGLLTADWLREPPEWLRSLTMSILLLRVGLEQPDFAAGVEEFVAAAHSSDSNVEIIEVPNGHHSFDMLDHTKESRDAVTRAMEWNLSALCRTGQVSDLTEARGAQSR